MRTAKGEDILFEADTVMIITQYGRNAALYDALEGVVAERHRVGDARQAKPFGASCSSLVIVLLPPL